MRWEKFPEEVVDGHGDGHVGCDLREEGVEDEEREIKARPREDIVRMWW